MALPERDMETR